MVVSRRARTAPLSPRWYHANMCSQASIDQALGDLDKGIELFEQRVHGNLSREERKRLAREALELRMEFDSLIAELLAELQRRQRTRIAAERHSSNQAS